MPADARQGHLWSDHRMVVNGILFRTRAGCPWRDLPGEYGNWKTVYNRHRRWSLDGTWEKILGRLQAGCDEAEGKDWTLSADSTVVRAHQHAAGARRALPAELIPRGRRRMTRFRSPGRAGRPWAFPRRAEHRDSPGRRPPVPPGHPDPHSRPARRLPAIHPLLEAVHIARRGKGRLRTRPGRAMADKAYSSAANPAYLRRRGIQAVIPVKEDQKRTAAPGDASAGGRRPSTLGITKNATPSNAALPSSSSSAL